MCNTCTRPETRKGTGSKETKKERKLQKKRERGKK